MKNADRCPGQERANKGWTYGRDATQMERSGHVSCPFWMPLGKLDQSKIVAEKHAQLQVVVFTTGIKLSEFSCKLQFYQIGRASCRERVYVLV